MGPQPHAHVSARQQPRLRASVVVLACTGAATCSPGLTCQCCICWTGPGPKLAYQSAAQPGHLKRAQGSKMSLLLWLQGRHRLCQRVPGQCEAPTGPYRCMQPEENALHAVLESLAALGWLPAALPVLWLRSWPPASRTRWAVLHAAPAHYHMFATQSPVFTRPWSLAPACR